MIKIVGDIILDKWVKGDYIKYEKIASKLGIPIKYEFYHQGNQFQQYSINKFVDLIEH